MLLKNNSKSVQQFSLNTISAEGAVSPRFLQVPSGATVEIDDEDWKMLTADLVKVLVYETTQEPIGTEEFGQAKIGKELLFKTVKVPTGRYNMVNLTLEMVKEGRLIVVEAPSTGLTTEQLVARINLVKGLSVDAENFSQEELEQVYLENEHKIENALAARKAVKENSIEA
jgi:hypothetical protein